MANSLTLLPTTTFNPSTSQPIYSDKFKGSGYLGASNPVQTVQYAVSGGIGGFVGSIKMQGTLVETPTDTDWFDIDDTTLNVNSVPESPLSDIRVFVGNFVWVRALATISTGTINRITYSYS